MTTYKLIASSDSVVRDDGAVIPANDGNRDWRAYQDWLAAGNAPTAADPLPAPVRTLTPREFRERIPADKQAAINAAAMTDAQVFDWRLRAAEAQVIELDNPETTAGIDFLISKGLLTDADKTAMLA